MLDYATIDTACWASLPNPPEYAPSSSSKKRAVKTTSSSANVDSYEKLKQKRAWDLAISPAKSLPMNAFMLYMSGGGIQIFSISILAMLLLNPIKAVAALNTAFAPFASAPVDAKPNKRAPATGNTLLLPKLAYIGCNILTLALGLWKCRSMGLLPTGTADWLAFEARGASPELSLF